MKLCQKKLSEQVMVVTGASSGIGLCTVKMAAKRGARVVLAAREEHALRETCEEIRSAGGQATYVVADVANEGDVRRIADAAIEVFGGFDTWVNNAGVAIYGTIEQTTLKDMRRLFDVNFWGLVYGCRIAAAHLREHGGTIINIGSVESEIALPLNGLYASSKHAVKAFSDVFRMELHKDDAPIGISLVKPSGINTPFFEHAQNYLEGVPQPPPGVYAPETVAEAILACAERFIPEVTVGGAGKLQTVMKSVAPRLTDKVMELTMFKAQENKHYSAGPQQESLYHPPAHNGRIEGTRYRWPVMKRSFFTSAQLHPTLTTATLATALFVGRSLWRTARSVS